MEEGRVRDMSQLEKQITILDGGLGQELRARAPEVDTALWSAQFLLDAPEAVRDVHRSYIDAGADVITTNSYITTRPRLEKMGVGERFVELNTLSGILAGQAREDVGRDVKIAGSLPPLLGSYRADLVLPFDEAEPLYREQAEVLAPYVDFFICETMSSAAEARAAASAARSVGKPVWVSWTLSDTVKHGGEAALRSGESIDVGAKAIEDLNVDAVLANCSAPETLTTVMSALKRCKAKGFGGYANGFSMIPDKWAIADSGIEALGTREDLGPDAYAAFAGKWLEAGATIIGGCCEVGPAHIARLAQILGRVDRLAA